MDKKLILCIVVAAAVYYFMFYRKNGSRGQAVPVAVNEAAAAVAAAPSSTEKVRVASQEDLLPKSVGMVPLNLMQNDPKSLLGLQDGAGQKMD